jgi:hypothetical protein
MRLMLFVALLVVVLAGCTTRPTLAELEEEAEITGDWSAVQQYRRMDKSMNRVNGDNYCKNGYILVCRTKAEREECGCVSPLDRSQRTN